MQGRAQVRQAKQRQDQRFFVPMLRQQSQLQVVPLLVEVSTVHERARALPGVPMQGAIDSVLQIQYRPSF